MTTRFDRLGKLVRRGGRSPVVGASGFTFSPAESAVQLPNTAIGISSEGLTLADSGTTVQAWASYLGGLSVTLTAPTTGQRPAYSATGGVGSRPLVSGDAIDNVLVAASAINFGSTIELGYVGSYAGTANRTVIALDDSTTYLWASTGPQHRANALTVNTVVSGALSTPVHASGDAASADVVNARIAGVIASTAAVGAGTFNARIALFARNSAGTNAGGGALQAWYIGPQLTASQRTYLRALLTHYTGVSS